jgi:hypothetical protein
MHAPDTLERSALIIDETWQPTPQNLNALPEPLCRYVFELATVCDPAGDVTWLHMLKAENKMLRQECARLAVKAGEAPVEVLNPVTGDPGFAIPRGIRATRD